MPVRNASGSRSTTVMSCGRCAKWPTPQKGGLLVGEHAQRPRARARSGRRRDTRARRPRPAAAATRAASARAAPLRARQLRAGHRLTVCQHAIEPETVSEADHRGGGGAAERVEDAARVGLEAVGIERTAHFFLRRALARATARARERIASLPVRFFAAAGFAARRGRDAGFFFAFGRALPRARAAAGLVPWRSASASPASGEAGLHVPARRASPFHGHHRRLRAAQVDPDDQVRRGDHCRTRMGVLVRPQRELGQGVERPGSGSFAPRASNCTRTPVWNCGR